MFVAMTFSMAVFADHTPPCGCTKNKTESCVKHCKDLKNKDTHASAGDTRTAHSDCPCKIKTDKPSTLK